MRVAIGTLGLALSLTFSAPVAQAGDGPVVVELFTSQGCSSCPPADAFLAQQLAGRDDVLPLALHVDYWDYIGWKDVFGAAANTQRQKGYARAAGHRTIYTPQMIIQGRDHVVGFKPMQVADLIAQHRAEPDRVALTARRDGDMVMVRATAVRAVSGEMVVLLVRYLPRKTVEIERGENAGRSIDYANIVTGMQAVARWDGAAPLDIAVPAAGSDNAAVLLQAEDNRGAPSGVVVAAAFAN